MKKTFKTTLRALEMHPPLVPYGTTFPPLWEACHWILSRLRLLANPVPLPPLAGEVRRSRKGGGERSEPISKMLIIPYDTEK